MVSSIRMDSGKAATMKKTFAIIFVSGAFALSLGLAACGNGNSSAAPSNEANTSAAVDSSAAASQNANTDSSAAISQSTTADSSAAASQEAEKKAQAEYDRACALFDEGKYYSAKVAFENSGYKDWEQRAAECVQPMPETGELYHNADMTSDNMMLNFVMDDADSGTGMYIAVYTKDHTLVETVFIKGAETVETWIPGGEYYIKDSSGKEWYGEDEQFGPDGLYETMVFDEVEGDPYLTVLDEGYAWDITLNTDGSEGQGVDSEETGWENRG